MKHRHTERLTPAEERELQQWREEALQDPELAETLLALERVFKSMEKVEKLANGGVK